MTSFNREKAAPLAIAVSASVLAAVTAAAFLVGSSSVSLGDLVAWATGGDVSASAKSILVNVRLPRVLAALLAGGALAVAGAIIQAVLDNPLASPNIIGINSGAGLFVLIAASVFPSALWLPPLAAFAGALATALIIFGISLGASTSRLTVVLAGIAIIGPVAASISTVSSLLISSSSALVKDVWMHYAEARGRRMGERALSVSSQAVTLGLGAVVFVLAVVPPDVIWKINMFAFGGLETAFFWVMVCGLFWRRANRTGALWSMAGGTLAYCATMALGFKVADLHQIVIGIVVAGVCMVAGSLAGKQAPASRMEVFFPDCDSGAEAANGSSARRAG